MRKVRIRIQISENFMIELQRAQQLLFYASRIIQDQGVKSKNWDYNFKGVYHSCTFKIIVNKLLQHTSCFRIIKKRT